jgi:hypothetical protein
MRLFGFFVLVAMAAIFISVGFPLSSFLFDLGFTGL